MRSDELDFSLPPEFIAQTPCADRASSRLLHYQRSTNSTAHRIFSDLPAILRPGDLLVFNDARVIPARLTLRKVTGGRIEGLFLAEDSPGVWQVMLRDVGRAGAGVEFDFPDEPGLRLRILDSLGEGQYRVQLSLPLLAFGLLARVGRMPLPPYIKRLKDSDERDSMDEARYQTIYANSPGSVAAPTAGLHFTPELLKELARAGVEQTFVTLHVGMGTFKPVAVENLEDHPMHTEAYTISPESAETINRARREGRRVICVGTTSARVLESQPTGSIIHAGQGQTSIFIYPPYAWKHVGALITNFHLPRSTLIALVAAFTGIDEQRKLYAEAIAERYRFFSYGDAMFIE